MIRKRFCLTSRVRVALLFGTLCVVDYLWDETELYAWTVVVSGLVAFQVYAFDRYGGRGHRSMAQWVRAVRQHDFTFSFPRTGQDESLAELHAELTAVQEQFLKTRAEREEAIQTLQTVISHIAAGVLCYGSDGGVILVNPEALRLLGRAELRSIHELESFSADLVRVMLAIEAGQRALVKVDGGGAELVLRATGFRLRGQDLTLISLQNIQRELYERQMQAWLDLLHVLRHEIMNSLNPTISLATAVRSRLGEAAGEFALPPVEGFDRPMTVAQAIGTIERRSRGLRTFVDRYNELTGIASPNVEVLPLADLVEEVAQLYSAEAAAKGVKLSVRVDPRSLRVKADPSLTEQALINLVKNAMQAVEGRTDGRIDLFAHTDGHGAVVIEVTDNGPGIPPDRLEKIFVPFYSTKKDGHGVGLSVSRWIMQLHGGSLGVRSEAGEETVFTMRW